MAEGICGDTANGVIRLDELFFHHLHSDSDGSKSSPLAVAGLKHKEATLFHRKFEILHVVKVALEGMTHVLELTVNLGHFHLELDDRLGCAYSGYNVFSLRVEEKLAVENFFACGGIACEGDAGTAIVSGISKDHGLNIHCGAPLVRDVVFSPINNCPFVVPRTEDCPYSTAELLAGIFWEIFPCTFAD